MRSLNTSRDYLKSMAEVAKVIKTRVSYGKGLVKLFRASSSGNTGPGCSWRLLECGGCCGGPGLIRGQCLLDLAWVSCLVCAVGDERLKRHDLSDAEWAHRGDGRGREGAGEAAAARGCGRDDGAA